ncbi:MAG: hypothetical protein AB1349_06280 [Elusimicrobiota bacterium]
MDRKQDLMNEISKLRQRRQYAERRCEMTGRMLPACLIFRARIKGQSSLKSVKAMDSTVEYKSYGILPVSTKVEISTNMFPKTR